MLHDTCGIVPLRNWERVVGELQIYPTKVVAILDEFSDEFAEEVTWQQIVDHNKSTKTAWSGRYLYINTRRPFVGVKYDPEVHRRNCYYLNMELADALESLEAFVSY